MQKPLIIAASVLAAVSLFAATPGIATAQPGETAIAVRIADLDLASPAGQQSLERRIARAARTICGMDVQTSGTRLASSEAGACYRQAMRDVRQRVAAVIESRRNGG